MEVRAMETRLDPAIMERLMERATILENNTSSWFNVDRISFTFHWLIQINNLWNWGRELNVRKRNSKAMIVY